MFSHSERPGFSVTGSTIDTCQYSSKKDHEYDWEPQVVVTIAEIGNPISKSDSGKLFVPLTTHKMASNDQI